MSLLTANGRGAVPLMVAAFVAFIGGWVANPLVAIVLAGRGVSAGVIGALAATSWVSAMGAAVLAAPLIRALGSPARVFRVGMVVASAAAALFGLAGPVWQFAALSAVFGAALSVAWTSADIGVIALAPRETLTRTIGTYQSVVAAAVCGGPVLLQFAGPGDPRAFFLASALLLIGAALSFLVPAPPAWTDAPAAGRVPRIVLPVMLFASLTGIAEAAAVSVLPVHALAVLGLSVAAAAAIPGLSAAGSLVIQYPLGRIVGGIGVPRLLLGGTVVAASAALLWPVAAGSAAGWAVMLAFGAGAGVFYTCATFLLTREALPDGEQARGLGLLNAGYLTGGALGAAVSGGAADALPGPFGLPVALACLIGATAAGGFALLRGRSKTPARAHDMAA